MLWILSLSLLCLHCAVPLLSCVALVLPLRCFGSAILPLCCFGSDCSLLVWSLGLPLLRLGVRWCVSTFGSQEDVGRKRLPGACPQVRPFVDREEGEECCVAMPSTTHVLLSDPDHHDEVKEMWYFSSFEPQCRVSLAFFDVAINSFKWV